MLIAALVQATLISRIRFLGACPNLILVMVVSWALLRGVATALPIAFVAGLFFDLLAGLPLGASSLGLMATTVSGGAGHATACLRATCYGRPSSSRWQRRSTRFSCLWRYSSTG